MTLRAARQASMRNWQAAVLALCILGVIAGIGASFYLRGQALMAGQIKEHLRDTAAAAAMQFDAEALAGIRGQDDLRSPALADAVRRLEAVRQVNPRIRYAYIMRRSEDPMTLLFVADADSLDTPDELDDDGDGVIEEDEEASYPGDPYDVSQMPAFRDGFLRPSVDQEITHDQWGEWISAYAPIRDADGVAVAVLGIDMEASQFAELSRSIFSPVLFLLVSMVAIVCAGHIVAYLRRGRAEMTKRIAEEQESLLHLASHQIGQSIVIFQWSMESLRECVAQKNFRDAEKYIDHMGVAVGRLNGILRDLHRATEMDQGTFPFVPETLSLRTIIEDASRGCNAELTDKNQTVTVDADAAPQVRADRNLLTSVLRELLRNASAFSPAGSAIRVAARLEGGHALVTVEDHGTGIPAHDLPRLFGKFARASNAHLSRPDGLGLGLFMARRIIERAGGSIWMESEEAKGARASFTLPLA